jgi:putative flippase GtrA
MSKTPVLEYLDKLRICGHKIPRYLFFMLSGAICDIGQIFVNWGIAVLYVYNWEKSTVCWTLSYIISIWMRHYSHKHLVFGEYEGTYWNSLMKMYLSYSSSIIWSTLIVYVMTSQLNFSLVEAFTFSKLFTGVYNYLVLKSSWKQPPLAKTSSNSLNSEDTEGLEPSNNPP